MSEPATWICWITAFASGLLGSLIGFWFGFKAGRKWGEADGIAWSTQRLEEARQQMARPDPSISANDEGLDGVEHRSLY